MARKYYTLAVRENGTWSAQFGDYDRQVVADEGDDCWNRRTGKGFASKDLKIICTSEKQVDIQAGIDKLNAI